MAMYTSRLKLEVVEYYLNNNLGYRKLAKLFNITSHSDVRRWVKKYQEHGVTGLIRNPEKYDGNFKINVIEYKNKNHLSFHETAVHFNLGGADRVTKWEQIYYEKGPQALYEERRGRSKNMNPKPKKKKLPKENETDLIAEVQQLRMECL